MANRLIIDFLGTFIDAQAIYQAVEGQEFGSQQACLSLPEILATAADKSKIHVFKKLGRLLKDKPLAFKPLQPLIQNLKILKEAGFQVGLFAPRLVVPAKKICDEYQINVFDFIEGDVSFFSGDASLGRALRKQAINPADVFYLSGTTSNLSLARQIKIKTIAHSWGLDALEDLQKAQPTYTILKPGELLTVMTEQLAV